MEVGGIVAPKSKYAIPKTLVHLLLIPLKTLDPMSFLLI